MNLLNKTISLLEVRGNDNNKQTKKFKSGTILLSYYGIPDNAIMKVVIDELTEDNLIFVFYCN